MNLVSLYVANVKQHLPLGMRDDVGDELQGMLEDRINAEASRLGRPLDDNEIAALLREYGNPHRVAVSYLPSPLHSGAVFALYKRTVGRLVRISFLVVIALSFYKIYSNPPSAMVVMVEYWHAVYDVLSFILIVITLVYYFAGPALDRLPRAWRWDPAHLPEPQGTWQPVSLPSVIGASILAVSFLAMIVAAPYSFESPEGSVAVGDGVRPLLPVLHGLALFALIQVVVNFFQRHVTRVKLYTWSATAIAIGALVTWIIVSHRVLVLTQPGLGKIREFILSIWPETILKILLALAVVLLVRSAFRAWRRARTPGLPLI